MKAHLRYFVHFLKHKWHFACVGWGRLPIRTLVWHDLDKLYPDEWGAHVKAFANRTTDKYAYTPEFYRAMQHHRHRNAHHWQHHVLIKDDGSFVLLEIPLKDLDEMLVDWMSSARARGGDVREWYAENKGKMLLHADTRAQLEQRLGGSNEHNLVRGDWLDAQGREIACL